MVEESGEEGRVAVLLRPLHYRSRGRSKMSQEEKKKEEHAPLQTSCKDGRITSR